MSAFAQVFDLAWKMLMVLIGIVLVAQCMLVLHRDCEAPWPDGVAFWTHDLSGNAICQQTRRVTK